MSDRTLFAGAMAFVGVAVLAAYFIMIQSKDAHADDTPGPNLVLEIGGSTQGRIVIDLLPHVAPQHVKRVIALAKSGAYDDVVFHRVIAGFMAQTGDVQFGKRGGDISMAGRGASELPDLPAEFTNVPFKRGTVGMARSASPDSGNSQFFIMFAPAANLNGQYTVFGRVIEGLDVLDKIKKGDPAENGLVTDPDYIVKATVVDE